MASLNHHPPVYSAALFPFTFSFLPVIYGGGGRNRTFVVQAQRVYSPSPLATREPLRKQKTGAVKRTFAGITRSRTILSPAPGTITISDYPQKVKIYSGQNPTSLSDPGEQTHLTYRRQPTTQGGGVCPLIPFRRSPAITGMKGESDCGHCRFPEKKGGPAPKKRGAVGRPGEYATEVASCATRMSRLHQNRDRHQFSRTKIGWQSLISRGRDRRSRSRRTSRACPRSCTRW